MIKLITKRNMRALFLALLVLIGTTAISQTASNKPKAISNPYGISDKDWTAYLNKTNLLSEQVDVQSFINYVLFNNDGNFNDMKYFMDYIKTKLKKDKEELIYKVGKGTITTTAEVSKYYADLQPKYNDYYLDFKKRRDQIVEASERTLRGASSGPLPTPLNCGSPCTNPGFEAGTGFWDYYTGTACASSTSDPCSIVAGFSSSQHVIQTVGGFDPVVGAALPVVPPGGGSSSLMLGDGPVTGGFASRASISFTVSAANANFTYRYACVLQDPVSGHTDPERPYFNVHLKDGSGNLIMCGEYMVMAKPPVVGFTETSPGSTIWWRNWTTVFVPLSSYIGQCVTVQFTSSDCAQGGHYGYAYIDGDCDPLVLLSSSPSICGGASVTLTAPAGGAAYAWTNTAGGTTGIVGSTTGSTAVVNAAGTYQCVITSTGGPTCTTTLTIVVGSSPISPVASFTNTTVCAGTPTAFTDTSTPGGITGWSWDFNGDAIADATTQNPTFTFASAGTYPVTLTVTIGACTATITQNITVNSGAVPTITPAGPFCANAAPVNLVGTPAGGTWSGTGITSAALGTFDPTIAVLGNNTVTYTTVGACGGTVNATVVVNAVPVTTVNSPTICPTTSANLTAAGATTYLWSTGAVINPINVTPAATTTYTVIGTTLGCTSSAIATVTVGGSLTPTVNSPAICAGGTATLTATGGTTYAWSDGSVTNPTNVTPATTTSYTVTANTGGCTGTVVATVTVNPLPVLVITNPVAVCSPGTIDITAAAVTAGTTGGVVMSYWTDAAATLTLASPTAIATAGTYYIEATTAGGCTDIAPVVVSFNPPPVSAAGPDITICTGGIGNLGAAAVAGDTYSWNPATGLSSAIASNPTVTLINASGPAILTSYTVTTTSAAGCTSTDVVVVTTDAVATANAGSTQSVCIGSSITLGGAVGGSATGGTWSGGTGTYAPNTTTLNAVYTPSAAEYAAGSVTLTLTTNDPTGPCTFASSNVTFTFFPTPMVIFTVDDPDGCPVHCVQFTDLSTVTTGTIASWSWNFGDGSPADLTQNPAHCYNNTGFYDVTLTVTSNNGCSATLVKPAYIQVFPDPIAEFYPNPNPATILDPTVTLNDGSSTPSGTITAWWYYFGDGDSINPNVPSPIHVYPNAAAGTYNATLTVQNSYGCFGSVMHPVEIGPEFTFFIPNAFTPNGDGVNDFFYGQGIGIVDYDLYIFDRWGNMIFHGHEINDMWNGKANGGDDIAQQDVYVWKVKLTDVFGKKHNYIGTVTLVK